ncbi:hypothetical protein BHE74_00007984 [Ensete ventricosum]|nr:hypothetical protein BHE74_00007984 [Ensete ventricosum]
MNWSSWIPINPGEAKLGGSSDGRLLKTWKLGEGPWKLERGRGANSAEETEQANEGKREMGGTQKAWSFSLSREALYSAASNLLLPAQGGGGGKREEIMMHRGDGRDLSGGDIVDG